MIVATLGDFGVAIITGIFLLAATALPLLWSVRKRLVRDVGVANGEGSVVEMMVRTLEQVGMVRAEQAAVKADLQAQMAAAAADRGVLKDGQAVNTASIVEIRNVLNGGTPGESSVEVENHG